MRYTVIEGNEKEHEEVEIATFLRFDDAAKFLENKQLYEMPWEYFYIVDDLDQNFN